MNFILFIANRLFQNKENRKGASTLAIRIATGGVAIGIAVMIISVCIVLGFKQEIRDRLIGFGSHVQIQNYNSLNAPESLPIDFNDTLKQILETTPEIEHWERVCYKTGMIKTEELFKGVVFKGADADFDTTFISKSILSGHMPLFSDKKPSNEILISETIAQELQLNTGDKITAYFFDGNIRARRFLIKGIYHTNLSEFDKNIVFTDFYTCHKLNNWHTGQCSSIHITLKNPDNLQSTARKLARRINLENGTDRYGATYATMSIEDLYPQLFSWLELLDTNIWVILILMTGVAGVTMISGLLIIILERTSFIGTLKALGAVNQSIRSIFLFFSLRLVGKGLLWGNTLAFLLLYLQKNFHLISLDPEIYYVETVPVLINWGYILLINLGTLIISVGVLVLPSLLISRIDPIKSIRFE